MTRSRRSRRGGHGGGGGGGGGHGGGDARWLVTYADLLTLLMVLFLVLWVISTIDLKKFEQFKSGLGDFGNKAASAAKPVAPTPDPNGLTNAPTINPDSTTTTIGAPIDTSTGNSTDATTGTATKPLDAQQLSGLVAGLNSTINSQGLGDVVNVHVEQRGLVVSISTDNVLFDSGQGALTPAGARIIHTVGPELSALANDMIVEGYTDKRPLRRQGYDNWDLSVDRAVSVLKVLRDDFSVPASRLAATGYGDQHPVAVGDDTASMARNRRIEIVVVAGPAS